MVSVPSGPPAQTPVQPPVQPPVRAPKTHKTEEIRKRLKDLSLDTRLSLNVDIEKQNEARQLKAYNHAADPANFPDDASDIASVITIESSERDSLRVPSFLALFSKVPKFILAWLAGEEQREKEKRKRDDALLGREAKRRCRDTADEKPHVVGSQTQIAFHQILYDTDDFVSIPLPFFTNKNLRYIMDHASTLATTKANPKPGETKGAWILDIPKLTAMFGEELSISYGEYSEAAPNCFRFHKSRDSLGPTGPYATWWLNHFGFFSRQHDKVENYPAWSHLELKERLNY